MGSNPIPRMSLSSKFALIPDYRYLTLINIGGIAHIFKELRYYSGVMLQHDYVTMQQNHKNHSVHYR